MQGYYDFKDNRKQFVSHLLNFDKNQITEIDLARLEGATVDQITVFARPQYSYTVMRAIYVAMRDHNMPISYADYMASFNNTHVMGAILDAYLKGVTLEEIKGYTNPTMSAEAIRVATEIFCDMKTEKD